MSSNIAKPSKVLITIGVLKGYMKKPFLFFVGMIMTLGKFKKSISDEFSKDFVEANAIIAWLYIRLQKKLPQEKAYEIIRAAIMTTGFALQQAGVRCVEDERTYTNLVKNQKRLHEYGITKHNTLKIIEDNERIYKFKVTRCVFLEFFTSLSIPELTKIFCSIDNALFSSYLPNEVMFYRDGLKSTMADGATECSFNIEKKLI